jgi:hypothetical protein
MAFFIPIVAGVGGFIVRRKVAIVGSALVYTYYDDAGKVIGEFIGEEASEEANKVIEEAGGLLQDVVSDIGNATLQLVEGFGVASITGIERTYDYIKTRFIYGKEPDIIAGFTVGLLSVMTIVFVYNSVKRGE